MCSHQLRVKVIVYTKDYVARVIYTAGIGAADVHSVGD